MLYYEEMAKLSVQDVLKLAQLAKLQLTEDELNHFSTDLSAILDYVEQLGDVDTGELEPTAQVTGLINATRPDTIIDYGTTPEDLLKNAPAVQDGQIKVKRMLG